MFASIVSTILGSLTDAILKGLFGLIQTEITRRENIAQGVAQQAASETAQSAKTETAIAQAEATGPSNAAEAVKRAQEGTI
jgi:hypothetical protein